MSFRSVQPASPDRLLLEALPGRVAYVDADARFGWSNRAYAEWLDHTPETLMGRSVREVVGEPAFRVIEPNLRRALAGEVVRYETELEYPTHGRRFIEVSYTPHRSDAGVAGFVVHVTDRTDHRRAELALATSEAEFRAIFELSPSGKAQADPATGRLVRVNRRFTEITGRPADELLELTLRDLTHPDDRARDEVLAAPVLRGERDAWSGETRYLRPDGEVAWVLVTGALVRDAAGSPWRIMVVLHDITELKRSQDERRRAEEAVRRSEERLRRITDAVPAVVWTADARGMVTFLNERWTELTGLSLTASLGGGFARAIHPDDRDRTLGAWNAALELGRPYETECRYLMADGSARWFLVRAEALLAADGSVEGWIGSSTDVEDKRRLEESFREADRRKDEFLAMLAHELRNPLAPIRTAVELLRLSPGAVSTVGRARDVIDRQAQHLSRLVDDLLEVSRVTTGKIRVELASVDGRDALTRAVETTRPFVEARGHALTISAPGRPVVVRADPTRLAQVIGNLLHNAAKYTPEGGRLELALSTDAGCAVFRVVDSGVGIRADELDRIFEPFTQIDASLDRSHGGLGIGLTLARRLVELHGGTITASSAGPGQGSTFTVTLPLVAGQLGEVPTRHENDGHSPGLHVLVVDDNRDAADTLGELLETMGHRATVVHDGKAAIAAAAVAAPDLVLLDIGLPGLTGYDVARGLRERHGPAVTIVALTGYGQEEDRRRARVAGFDEHLVKPLDLDALDRLLAACARRT